MPYIWIYWLISIILTFIVIIGWRIWWVNQDRKFQKRLPKVVRSTALDKGRLQTLNATEQTSAKSFWAEVFGVTSPKEITKHSLP